MDIALYARVSTTRQQQQQTIEQQITRVREHIATQPDWHLAEDHIYRDEGIVAVRSSVRVWIACGIGRRWRPASECSLRLPIAWRGTSCISYSSSTNSSTMGVRWNFWTGS
jgi:Resolvase, N terminal domain